MYSQIFLSCKMNNCCPDLESEGLKKVWLPWQPQLQNSKHPSKLPQVFGGKRVSYSSLQTVYLGSGVTIGQNTASDPFLLYGASFWESQPLQMPNLAP